MIYAEQITANTVEAAGETITAGAWAQVSSFAAGQCDFNVVISIGGDAVDYTTFGNPVATNTLVITNSTDAPVTAPDTAANPTYAGSSGGQSGWTYFTVQYVTTAADVGQTIGVSVGSDGGYPAGTGSASLSFFDDVTLDTVVPGAPTVVSLTVSTNQVIRNGSAVITATIMPGVNDIATVTVDASLFGGSSAQTLVYSNTVDGNFVYTNTITASAPAFYDNPIPLPLTVNDVNGLTGGAGTNLVVASPPVLTWGGGNGNWTDGNWLPGGVVGPAASYSIAIVTNGVVTGNYPQSGGGIGKVSSIILAPSGTLTLSVGAIYNLSNLQFTGGTLDIFDNTEWGTYGVATLKALTASGAVTSTITNSCTTPGRGDPGPAFFNVASPSSTITVSNGATLTVSAELRDYPSGASMLIKSGAGLLELSGTNTYTGGTTVAQGTLKVSSTIALQTNTTLTVSNGATVNLNYSGMIALGALVLDGVSQANGTYGAIGSSATYTSTNFIGLGVISVNFSSPILTWGGGNGNWTDPNWLPGDVTGPLATNGVGIVTNGVVTANIGNSSSGSDLRDISAIVLAPNGTLSVSGANLNTFANLQFIGGTLDMTANGGYGYGSCILKALTASGPIPSVITNSSSVVGYYTLGSSGGCTFTVSNGAVLTVSANLIDTPPYVDKEATYTNVYYYPGAVIKSGAGLLELSGVNINTLGAVVSQGTLQLDSITALQTNTPLSVSNSAIVNLNYSGTITVSSLTLGGVSQANGTYGATGSGAVNINDTYFTGTGVISIGSSTPPPPFLTWGGGNGNWTDMNWLPGNVAGPLSTSGIGIVTNGIVTANIGNGSSGSDLRDISAIVLAPSGTLSVSGANLNTFANLQFIGGTLDMTANGGYGYGSCILKALTASGPIPSVITNSSSVAGYYTLGSSGGCTFTVSNGAVLTVSANLIDTPPYVDKEATYTNVYYYPGAVIKSGAGLLELSGANINTGGIIVQQGTLQLDSITAFQTNTPLSVAGSAIVNLNYSGTITASSLTLGGVTQASGTYGATGSGAANINDTYFTGTGVISVPGPLTLSQLNLGNGQLQFSWDTATYPGAVLQVQTNSLSPTGWVDYSGTSPVTVPIDPTVGSVFFRMKQ